MSKLFWMSETWLFWNKYSRDTATARKNQLEWGFSKDLATKLVIKNYVISLISLNISQKITWKFFPVKNSVFLGSHHPFFQGRPYGSHKLELDVKGKEETQGHNSNILSFTELRVNEMSFFCKPGRNIWYFGHWTLQIHIYPLTEMFCA